MNSLATLYAVFKTLQPELRAWLTSDEAMAMIGTVASEFVLSKTQERQLPILILRLVTQDIPPESFKAALAERLGVSPDIAGQVAKRMHEGIFAPVAQALRFNGVDVEVIGFDAPLRPSGSPTPLSELRRTNAGQTSTSPIPQPAPMPIPPKNEARTSKLDPPPPVADGGRNAPAPTPAPARPFILHAEPKPAAPEPVKPSFSFTAPPAAASAGRRSAGQSAPKVVIERVVHYGALTTPLNQPSIKPRRFS